MSENQKLPLQPLAQVPVFTLEQALELGLIDLVDELEGEGELAMGWDDHQTQPETNEQALAGLIADLTGKFST